MSSMNNPEGFHTEWGYRSPWGDSWTRDGSFPAAHTIVTNMRKAGNEASIIWRSVSDTQEFDEGD